jgi:hypothetical protein
MEFINNYKKFTLKRGENKMKKLSILFIMLAAILFMAGNVYAYNSYYNNFYVGLNGGVANTGASGYSKSGDTFNLTLGKNFNNNNVIIGVGALLGYTDNGSEYGFGIHSASYGAFLKGGYNFQGLMPFVKLGYIGYTFGVSASNSSYYIAAVSESGLLYGAGFEYLFNPNWGLTVQYLGAALSNSIRINNFTVGIDFNF